MHHPKPNKTGSLALRITYVYSVFAACIEGSSSAAAINVCVWGGGRDACVSIHICMFAVGSCWMWRTTAKSHIGTLSKFFLWKIFTLPYREMTRKKVYTFDLYYLLILLMSKCFLTDEICQYEKFQYTNKMFFPQYLSSFNNQIL